MHPGIDRYNRVWKPTGLNRVVDGPAAAHSESHDIPPSIVWIISGRWPLIHSCAILENGAFVLDSEPYHGYQDIQHQRTAPPIEHSSSLEQEEGTIETALGGPGQGVSFDLSGVSVAFLVQRD